jgi:hypothetical protein
LEPGDAVGDYLKAWVVADLKEWEHRINDEESEGARFVRNVVCVLDGAQANLAVFQKLAPGDLPARSVHVIKLGMLAPSGTKVQWSGAVLVDAARVALCVFR